MNEKDRIRFQHILDSIERLNKFTIDKTIDSLKNDDMLLLAVMKSIEIIGEAASRITKETTETFPELPWKSIITMRNRLIHGYFDINHLVIWNTIIDDIPMLKEMILKILCKGIKST
jgi:uncharacterized protein with HEPN domain